MFGCSDVRMFTTGWAALRRRSACRTADVLQQLEFGVELDTKRQVLVTAGFQQKVCEECRGLPLTPHPMAASPGRTSNSNISPSYRTGLIQRDTQNSRYLSRVGFLWRVILPDTGC